jgi:LysM repeat protein
MSETTGNTKVCPTCGTRVKEDAARCLVCGTTFKDGGKSAAGRKTAAEPSEIRGSRMPEMTLSIPIILGLFLFFLLVGAGLTYLGLRATGGVVEATPAATATQTLEPSLTPTPETPTATHTPQPTSTPFSYIVKEGDTCGLIAATFNVSVQSLIQSNPTVLDANCTLFLNVELQIPAPTATPTPLATSTLTDFEATRSACETETYLVVEGDTLSSIAFFYGFDDTTAIMEWNGKTVDTAFVGERLEIPKCQITFVFGAGTVTPSPAPPYPAPEPLLPPDGDAFSLSNDTVTIQWSSVGELRTNEFYQVTVIDITSGGNVQLTDEVRDTKFVIPTSMRPNETRPHVFRWSVVPVAQIGVDEAGNPVFSTGGLPSDWRVFTWSGGAAAGGTATPTP